MPTRTGYGSTTFEYQAGGFMNSPSQKVDSPSGGKKVRWLHLGLLELMLVSRRFSVDGFLITYDEFPCLF